MIWALKTKDRKEALETAKTEAHAIAHTLQEQKVLLTRLIGRNCLDMMKELEDAVLRGLHSKSRYHFFIASFHIA